MRAKNTAAAEKNGAVKIIQDENLLFLPLKPVTLQKLQNCVLQRQKESNMAKRAILLALAAFCVMAAWITYGIGAAKPEAVASIWLAIFVLFVPALALVWYKSKTKIQKAILDGRVTAALTFTDAYLIEERRSAGKDCGTNTARQYAYVYVQTESKVWKLEFSAFAISRTEKDSLGRMPIYIGRVKDELFAFTEWELEKGIAVCL